MQEETATHRTGWRLVAGARDLSADETIQGREPWTRWGWLLGGIWVVFMLFPIVGAWTSDRPLANRVVGTTLLIGYSVVYLVVFLKMIHSEDWRIAARRGRVGIVVMAALMVIASLFVGVDALGAGAFLVSIAMFSGRTRVAVLSAVGIFAALYAALSIVLLVTPNGFAEYGILYMPPAIVLITVGAVRMINSAQERHEIVSRQRDLVAERERVARDVHDVLGHSLTIVTVKAELAERLVDIDPARAKDEIAQIRSLSREALAEVRATVSGLRVARLADELGNAAEALRAAGISAELPTDSELVDPRYRIVVAWVLREAVTNVVRHSRASRCIVRLGSDTVVIEDDGSGITEEQARYGMRGVRERVEGAGAQLRIGAAAELAPHGTRVEVTW